MKGKVNQAMKLGVPVVATRLAMEGMHARDGVDCMVADSAEEFADKVGRAVCHCVGPTACKALHGPSLGDSGASKQCTKS